MKPDFDGPWELISDKFDEKYDKVWDKFFSVIRVKQPWAFKKSDFPTPPDVYTNAYQPYEDKSRFDPIFVEIFRECLGEDDWMYALDWQHDCFRYNPRVPDNIEYPIMHDDGICEIWFPPFYTDGDDYFFVAKDFSWGWFTLPHHENNIWVYGDKLKKLIAEKADILELEKERNA